MSDSTATPSREYSLDDLETTREGYAIPECPSCEQPIDWLLSASGKCPVCEARFELDVRVSAQVIDE